MTDRKTYHYLYNTEGDTDPDCAYPFVSDWETGYTGLDDEFVSFGTLIAKDAAKDHFHDSDWQHGTRQITVLLPDGSLVGTYEVELEYVPAFYATEIK